MRIIDEREQLHIILGLVKDSQELRQREKEDSHKRQQELNNKIGSLSKENYELKKQLKDTNEKAKPE